MQSQKIDLLSKAFVKASAELLAVRADQKNTFLNTTFTSFGTIVEASKPVLASHGLAIQQWPVGDGKDSAGVRIRLLHESGQWQEDVIYLPLMERKGRTLTQEAGSILTYLKRYTWTSLLGMYTGEVDDDGGKPSETKTAPKADVETGEMPLPWNAKNVDAAKKFLVDNDIVPPKVPNETIAMALNLSPFRPGDALDVKYFKYYRGNIDEGMPKTQAAVKAKTQWDEHNKPVVPF